ncbi:MAG: hypothetical protein NWS69_07585, partial [Pseudomonadales bacterium]|nr:hypothetical protein [Pseudomonadales bacterium]
MTLGIGPTLSLSLCHKLSGIHVLHFWRKVTKHLPANLFSPAAKYRLLLGISLRETPASQPVFACGEIQVTS